MREEKNEISLPAKRIERQELVFLFKLIKECHDSFIVNTEKVDTWYMILKDYEFVRLKDNLLKHLSTSSYIPKPSDLINDGKKEEYARRAIPGIEETKQLLLEQEARKIDPNDPAIIAAREKAKAEIERLFGKRFKR